MRTLLLFAGLLLFSMDVQAAPTKPTTTKTLAPLLQTYTARQLNQQVQWLQVKAGPSIHKSLQYPQQSKPWKQAMALAGHQLAARKIKEIVFVHGTFVGNDPLGAIHLLKLLYPSLSTRKMKEIQSWARKFNNQLFQEEGNFTPDYIRLFCKGLGHLIRCSPFAWSSSNFHAARLQGAIRLVRRLVALRKKRKLRKDEKILLVGHSHAGQLFALLSQFYANSQYTKPLLSIAFANRQGKQNKQSHQDRQKFLQQLQTLQKVPLELMTLGTPPRYRFAKHPHLRVLHVVNHRGKSFRGGSIPSALTSKFGDYVQQWGIAGSDLIYVGNDWKWQNKQLNRWLGPGADPLFLKKAISYQMRLPNQGKTLLVDYKDSSLTRKLPKFLSNVLGHAVYTRSQWMLFTARLLAKKL